MNRRVKFIFLLLTDAGKLLWHGFMQYFFKKIYRVKCPLGSISGEARTAKKPAEKTEDFFPDLSGIGDQIARDLPKTWNPVSYRYPESETNKDSKPADSFSGHAQP